MRSRCTATLGKALATCLLTAAVVALPLRSQQPPEAELTRLEAEAEEHYTAGDLEAAVAIYHELADRRTDVEGKVQALITAAWLEHRLGREEMAEVTLAQALSLGPGHPFEPANYDPGFADLYRRTAEERTAELRWQAAGDVRQGIEALEAGSVEEARDAFERALAVNPDDPATLYFLGRAEVAAGETESGAERLRQVAEWEEEAGTLELPLALRLAALSALARLDLEASRDEAAIAGFQKVLALLHGIDPAEVDAGLLVSSHSSLGYLFYRQGLLEDAVSHLAAALEIDGSRATDWHNLARARQALGRQGPAIDAFRRALALEPGNPSVASGLAAALRDSGDWHAAAELLTQTVRDHAEEPELWLQLGAARRHLGDAEGAIEALEQAVRLDDANRSGTAVRSALQLAFLHLEGSDPSPASEMARRALEWDGDNVDAWLYLCIAQQNLDDLEAALTSCRRAFELDPSRAELSSHLGIIQAQLRDYRAAEEALRRALSLQPDLETARSGLATLRENLSRRARDLGLVLAEDRSPPDGARVASVTPRSMAAAANLEAGDLIRRADDRPIASADDLLYYLAGLDPPGEVSLEVLRGGRTKSLRLRY